MSTLFEGRVRAPLRRARVSHRGAALALLLLVGCAGSSDGPIPPTTPTTPTTPTPPTPTPGFTVDASAPVPASIAQGDSALITITVQRTGGFTGAVTLSLSNTSDSLTPTFSTTRLDSTATTATVSLVASMLTVPATYPITVRATADGQAARADTVSLAVTVRPTSLTLSLDRSTALSGARGGLPITFGLLGRRNGVVGDLTFDLADTLPRGITVAFDPATTAGGSTTVTLRSDSTTVPATYSTTFRVRGPGGAPTGVLPVTYTVLPDAAITLTVSSPTVTIEQNANAISALTIVRSNFTGNVELSERDVPRGVTVTYERAPSSGLDPRYNVRFTADGTAEPGTYPITIIGSSPGVPSATVVVTLTVTPAPVGGDIVFAFCGPANERPIWFGTGRSGAQFTRRTPEPGDRYVFSLTTRTGDVAWVTQHGPDDFRITVFTGTPAELRAYGATICPSATGRSITGTLSGLTGTDVGAVAVGPRTAAPSPTSASPSFTIADVPTGPVDVIAARLRTAATPGTLLADRVFVQRAADPAGGALGTLDLAGALGTDALQLTLAGAQAGDQITATSTFRTTTGASVLLSTSTGTGTEHAARAMPAASWIAGDLHQFTTSAARTDGGDQVWQSVTHTVAAPAAVTLSLGATPPAPDITVFESDGVSFVRYAARVSERPDYARFYGVSYTQSLGATHRTMLLIGTAEGIPTLNGPETRWLRAPQFGGASGWNRLWEPRVTLPIAWTVSAFGWDAVGGIAAPQVDGTTVRSYTRSGTLPAP